MKYYFIQKKNKYHYLQPGTKAKIFHADSQADVETFRQDTIDPDQDHDD